MMANLTVMPSTLQSILGSRGLSSEGTPPGCTPSTVRALLQTVFTAARRARQEFSPALRCCQGWCAAPPFHGWSVDAPHLGQSQGDKTNNHDIPVLVEGDKCEQCIGNTRGLTTKTKAFLDVMDPTTKGLIEEFDKKTSNKIILMIQEGTFFDVSHAFENDVLGQLHA